MDPTIVAAIIGAIAVIIVALFPFFKKKGEEKEIKRYSPRTLYILGANIAKIGWAKAVPNQAAKNIILSTIALLNDLKFQKSFIKELESFAEKKESITGLKDSLPQIKKLFGNHIATQFGTPASVFYDLGFNMVNICPMFEVASLKVDEAGPVVIELINDIVRGAQSSGLPTEKLKSICKLAEKGLAEKKGELFDQAREDLIGVGGDYINHLEAVK